MVGEEKNYQENSQEEESLYKYKLWFIFVDDEEGARERMKDLYEAIAEPLDKRKSLLNRINNLLRERGFITRIEEVCYEDFGTTEEAEKFISEREEKDRIFLITDERFSENQVTGSEKGGHSLVKRVLKSDYSHRVFSIVLTSAYMRDYYEDVIETTQIRNRNVGLHIIPKEEFTALGKDEFLEKLDIFLIDRIIDWAGRFTTEYEKKIIETQKEVLLEAFFGALYLKDHEVTPFHVYRVAHAAETIAELMGYNRDKVEKIKFAGYLHDIGKLAIEDSILNSKSRLEIFEMLEMIKHAVYTLFLMNRLEKKIELMKFKEFKEWFEEVAEIAINHHEKRTGKGYPRGLGGDKITEDMEILIVADIYDALRQPRSYKRALSHEEAVKILEEMVNKGEISKTVVEYVKEEEFVEKYKDICKEATQKRKEWQDTLKGARGMLEKTPLYQELKKTLNQKMGVAVDKDVS